MEGTVTLKGVNFTLCSDSADNPECNEVFALSLENIVTRLDANDVYMHILVLLCVLILIQWARNYLDYVFYFQAKGFGKSDLRITIWDVQVDNQKYSNGGYDFCVVMTGRGSSSSDSNIKAIDSHDFLSQGPSRPVGTPAMDIKVGLDVTHSLGMATRLRKLCFPYDYLLVLHLVYYFTFQFWRILKLQLCLLNYS